jgi:large subunit ribosomal protein L5
MNIKSAKIKYKDTVIPQMMEKFGLKNALAVPQLEKIVLNIGTGKFIKESDKIDEILKTLGEITGQRPIKTTAKKAISGFKIRQGLEVGAKVTLRGKRMWDFIDRYVNFTLPRTRDFQGIDQKSIDQNGNLNIGIKEHVIFPEVSPEKVKNIFGLEVTFVTNAKNHEKGIELFKLLGFPIKQTN